MKVAICGYLPLALQLQQGLQNSNIEVKFFIKDFIIESGGGVTPNLPLIDFFYFRRLVNAGELDGVIIAADAQSNFTKELVPILKFYGIAQVGVIDLTLPNPNMPIYWLDADKAYISYLNTNLIDGCNLKCKGCTHFAAFFKQNEVYPLESFWRDIRRLSQICDVVSFRLLGGEPLLLNNLDEYVKISRQFFPKSNLGIVTNGLLLPATSQKILDKLRENNFVVYVSLYPPTLKVLDKIKLLLEKNKLACDFIGPIQTFGVFMTLHGGNNPRESRKYCMSNDSCRFLRDGKIYKCPPDALSYRLVEKFGIAGFPKATGVDLYVSNFSSMLERLDGTVEMCHWCSERPSREIIWEPTNNPKLEDWLADPDEKNIL